MPPERRYEGFLPGQYPIESVGAGGFSFGGMSHRGSILALPDGIRAIKPQSFAELDEAALAPLFALPRGSVDLMLFGCGPSLVPLPPPLKRRLRELGISSDPMSTGAACQTYNILLGERRLVGGLFIAIA
jgi:uncharacterized protein